jgi:uncharacterized DUF497 family protein
MPYFRRCLDEYGIAVYVLGMEFEWDPAKRATNLAKHGIDFPAAARVLDDPKMVSERDPRNYGEEMRYRAIGSVEGTVLLVCFTMRGERCRIISARRTNHRERKAYSL